MSHKEHEYLGISQKAIFYNPQDQKFLLVKSADRKTQESIDYLGWWEFVGGRIDEGEDPVESLMREICEEIGEAANFEVSGVVDADLLRWADKKIFVVGYLAVHTDGEIKLSEEHDGYRWMTAEEIEKNEEYKPWVKRFVRAAVERLKEREYLNDLKRLQADFENYRRRQQEAQKELGAHLIEKLVMELIPVLDNFRSATQHVPEASKDDPWVVGIQYIEKQLEDVLSANGMQPLEVKEGDAFDPRLHEAVGQAGEGEEGEGSGADTIVKVLQKGYRLGDRVVRPAKVIVG
jgi:molecular chaperone GrpE